MAMDIYSLVEKSDYAFLIRLEIVSVKSTRHKACQLRSIRSGLKNVLSPDSILSTVTLRMRANISASFVFLQHTTLEYLVV